MAGSNAPGAFLVFAKINPCNVFRTGVRMYFSEKIILGLGAL